MPGNGVNAATVPGAISGYDALLKRFGTMTFKETFERAARIAEEGWGQAERRHSDLRGAVNGLRADPDSKADVPRSATRRRRSTASSAIPALAKALRLIQTAGPRRASTRATSPTPSSRRCRPNGGVMTASRPRRVPVGVGRADLDQLPRLRRLRAAAARPGLRRARDAEHPRGVRAEARHEPRDARAVGSDVLAPDGRGEEARLRGPAGEERRSEVRARCRSSELLSKAYAATLCGKIDPNVASASRASPAAPTAARSI